METKIKGIDGIEEGARIIKEGGIVAFATETVYGLGADAFNEKAVAKIFEAKGRPQDNPLIVHIAGIEDAQRAAELTDTAVKLFKAFSPGPLTLVLKKKKELPYAVTAGVDTVGIRMPRHYAARALIQKSQTLIAAPSANSSTRISPTTALHVYEDMRGKIPLIIDGGDCAVGIESTVLDLTGNTPQILRPGAVTIEMLLKYLPEVKNFQGEIKTAPSPGMKYKHYAPIVDCVLSRTALSALKEYKRARAEGKKAVIMGRKGYISDKSVDFIDLGQTSEQIARNLYRKMREAEKIYNLIIIEEFSRKDLEYSIMNRLIKSSQGVII